MPKLRSGAGILLHRNLIEMAADCDPLFVEKQEAFFCKNLEVLSKMLEGAEKNSKLGHIF